MKRIVAAILLLLPVLTQAAGETKWGLRYEERQRIWLETMRAQNRADAVATIMCPTVQGKAMMPLLSNRSRISDSFAAVYISDLRLSHHITGAVYDSVIAEGIRYDWNRRR